MRIWILCFAMLTVKLSLAQTATKVDTTLQTVVDRVPEFIGGIKGWQKFLVNTIDVTSSVAAMDSAAYVKYGPVQTAVLEFTVCQDGSICDITILNKNKICPEFAAETIRVMKKSPKWKPGYLGNLPVKTRFRQNIKAVLEE